MRVAARAATRSGEVEASIAAEALRLAPGCLAPELCLVPDPGESALLADLPVTHTATLSVDAGHCNKNLFHQSQATVKSSTVLAFADNPREKRRTK